LIERLCHALILLGSCQFLSLVLFVRFINEEALAWELAGYYFMDIGQKDVSMSHILKAHEKYFEWGAIAKANALYEFSTSSMDESDQDSKR